MLQKYNYYIQSIVFEIALFKRVNNAYYVLTRKCVNEPTGILFAFLILNAGLL